MSQSSFNSRLWCVQLHEPKWKDGSAVADEQRCDLEKCFKVLSAWKREANSDAAAA